MTYEVGLGADVEEVPTEDDAKVLALFWAEKVAEALGTDPDDLEFYGGPDDPEWGICPDGDNGAWYPSIRKVEK